MELPDNPLIEIAPGIAVEQDVLGIVEEVTARWPHLRVQYLPPERFTEVTDAPYQVVEQLPDGRDVLVCQVWTLDRRLIDQLHAADTWALKFKQDMLFAMEQQNANRRADIKKENRERTDAEDEMVADVLRSPKDTFTATNPVTGKKHKFTATRQNGDRS
jgi:hypothetical protein